MQLGEDVERAFPSANPHPTSAKLKPPPFESTNLYSCSYKNLVDRYERYVLDEIEGRKYYENKVQERLDELDKRFSSVNEEEEECRQSLAEMGLNDGNLVPDTVIVA